MIFTLDVVPLSATLSELVLTGHDPKSSKSTGPISLGMRSSSLESERNAVAKRLAAFASQWRVTVML
jgi:hypothetical protein